MTLPEGFISDVCGLQWKHVFACPFASLHSTDLLHFQVAFRAIWMQLLNGNNIINVVQKCKLSKTISYINAVLQCDF